MSNTKFAQRHSILGTLKFGRVLWHLICHFVLPWQHSGIGGLIDSLSLGCRAASKQATMNLWISIIRLQGFENQSSQTPSRQNLSHFNISHRAIYGCETWTITKTLIDKLEACEL